VFVSRRWWWCSTALDGRGRSGACAQDININFGQGSGLTERVIQLIAFLTVLSLAPWILIMMTSFTRSLPAVAQTRERSGDSSGRRKLPPEVAKFCGDPGLRRRHNHQNAASALIHCSPCPSQVSADSHPNGRH